MAKLNEGGMELWRELNIFNVSMSYSMRDSGKKREWNKTRGILQYTSYLMSCNRIKYTFVIVYWIHIAKPVCKASK